MAWQNHIDTVQKYYMAYYGRPGDPAGVRYWAQRLDAAGGDESAMIDAFGTSAEATAYYGTITADNIGDVIDTIYDQLFDRAPDAAGKQFYVDAFTAGTMTAASIAVDILNGATGDDAVDIANKLEYCKDFTDALDPDGDYIGPFQATYDSNDLAAARDLLAAVDSTNPKTEAQVVEDIKSNIADSGDGILVEVTNQVYRLTTGVDNIAGSTGDDTFDGSRNTTGVAADTLNNADKLAGGAGVDTLFAQSAPAAAATTTPSSMTGIEVVDLENMGGAAWTLDLVNSDSSVTTVNTANNANALVVNNIQSAPTSFGISNTAQNFTATVTGSRLTGTSDEATVTYSNVTAGTTTIQPTAAGSGYETFNIVSNGSVANVLTAFTDGNGNSLTTVNISGAQNLTLPLNDATVTTVNAGTFTGILNLTVALGNTQNMTVTGGSGNDILNMNGTYTANDVINGGNGTDRLVLTNAEAIAAATAQAGVTNIEWLRLSDTTNGTGITVSNFGATGLQLGAAVNHTGNVVANFAAGTANFDRQDSTDNAAETTTINMAGVATTDVLNVTLGTTAAASTWNGGGAFTINGAETVNIFTQGGAATIGGTLTLTNTAASEAIVVTGNQNLIITGVVTADSINASGMTGNAVLQMNGGSAAQSIAITGTANADTLIGGTQADIINGGSGADVIQNAISGANSAANDILSGGAGFDQFRLVGASASAANYTGSAFIADFTVGTTAATTDILVLDITVGSYGATDIVTAPSTSIGATAAGNVVVQNVAQNAAATPGINGAGVIKLTTGVAFNTNLQTTFNNAIGTATVTGYTAADDVFVVLYDTTNSRAVFGLVDVGAADTILGTADVITLIGTISMTAADYANFNGNNIAFVDF